MRETQPLHQNPRIARRMAGPRELLLSGKPAYTTIDVSGLQIAPAAVEPSIPDSVHTNGTTQDGATSSAKRKPFVHESQSFEQLRDALKVEPSRKNYVNGSRRSLGSNWH